MFDLIIAFVWDSCLKYVVFIGILGIVALVMTYDALEERFWDTTEGRVVETYIEQRPTRGVDKYAPFVVYAYTANGKTYQSNLITHGEIPLLNDRDAQKAIAKYPVGSTVKVHYNPDNPAEATLALSSGSSMFFVWILLALAILASVWQATKILDALGLLKKKTKPLVYLPQPSVDELVQ